MQGEFLDSIGYAFQAELLSTWVELYNQRLLRLAFAFLDDEHAAQDCVQEALIKAGIKAHQLRNVEKPFTWLARIVINECRSLHKKNAGRNVASIDDVSQIAIEDRYPSLTVSTVREAVSELPYKLRTAIQLYYWADYNTVEIADIMNVSEATCRVWLHRGRLKIRKKMEGLKDDLSQ